MATRQLDLLLSSGFLGFARHLGFLKAVQDAGVSFDAVVGTSSGAVIGALVAAGHGWEHIRSLFGALPPIRYFALSSRPWAGTCTLRPLMRVLERELPARFDELASPLGLGVCSADGSHHLITHGDLRQAVIASCSVPRLCVPTALNGHRNADGGAVNRVGVAAWRRWRPDRSAILHRIERRFGVEPPAELQGVFSVDSPRSRASLLSWRDFDSQMAESASLTERRLPLLFGPNGTT